MSGAEPVEVVAEDGTVLAVVPRDEMRRRNLRHRAVYVVVRDGTRILAHQRAAWKDVWPSRWDVAFGGVVGPGEEWVDAAVRELAEEIGARVAPGALAPLGGGRYEDGEVRVVGRVFAVTAVGPFRFTDDEVVATEWVALADLPGWLAGHELVPDSRDLVVPYLSPPEG